MKSELQLRRACEKAGAPYIAPAPGESTAQRNNRLERMRRFIRTRRQTAETRLYWQSVDTGAPLLPQEVPASAARCGESAAEVAAPPESEHVGIASRDAVAEVGCTQMMSSLTLEDGDMPGEIDRAGAQLSPHAPAEATHAYPDDDDGGAETSARSSPAPTPHSDEGCRSVDESRTRIGLSGALTVAAPASQPIGRASAENRTRAAPQRLLTEQSAMETARRNMALHVVRLSGPFASCIARLALRPRQLHFHLLNLFEHGSPTERIRCFLSTSALPPSLEPSHRQTAASVRAFRDFDRQGGRILGTTTCRVGNVRADTSPSYRALASPTRGVHTLRSSSCPRVLFKDGRGRLLVRGISLVQSIRLMSFRCAARIARTLHEARASAWAERPGERVSSARGYVDRSIPPYPLQRFIEHALTAGTRLYAVELFGGIGAFGEAASQSHCELVGSTCVDIDPVAVATYSLLRAAQSPVAIEGDVCAFDFAAHLRSIREAHPGTKIWVHASPPCGDMCGQNAEGDARVRRTRVERGRALTLHALEMLEEMMAVGLADQATLENVKEAACVLRPRPERPRPAPWYNYKPFAEPTYCTNCPRVGQTAGCAHEPDSLTPRAIHNSLRPEGRGRARLAAGTRLGGVTIASCSFSDSRRETQIGMPFAGSWQLASSQVPPGSVGAGASSAQPVRSAELAVVPTEAELATINKEQAGPRDSRCPQIQ
jgi:hypothetical protein